MDSFEVNVVDENEGENVVDENVMHEDLNVIDEDEPNESKMPIKRCRSYSSNVWSIFQKPVLHSDGKVRCKCKYCLKDYVGGDNKNGTSTLQRHMGKCEVYLKTQSNPNSDIGKMILDHSGRLRTKKLDHNTVCEMISMMLIEHDLPFSFVEHRRFKELLHYLHPDVKVPSRRVATINVNNLYDSEKKKLKYMLSKVPSRISLTSDVWTSCTSEGYISLTAHYVDANWKLNSKMLNFSHFPPPHSGREMAKVIYGFLEEWGIERKKFSLTLDNASSNDKMQDYLKERLLLHNNGLVGGGEFFHIRCCAHILNLIVQEGLKVVGPAINKIRESIKYVKGSEGRMRVFKACVAKVGGIHTKMGLCLDVITRWNSTFLMLESALVYRRVFCSLAFEDRSYSCCPTNEEWERGQKMCDFLRPFFQITELISGSSYPTSNLYFMQVWKIECLLLQNLSNEDELIRTMTIEMKAKFDKYWSDYSNVLSFGCILDPRFKIKLLKYCYSKLGLDPISCQAKLKIVEHKLYTLYNEYVQMYSKETISNLGLSQSSSQEFVATTSVGQGNPPISQVDVMDEFIQFEDEDVSQVGKSQLDTYLEEANLPNKYHPNLDVLQYWKDNQARFPDLSLLASDILSIQITTVASEPAFSIGSRVLNKYRTRLLSDNVQALICTKNWLLGFDVQGKEDEDVVMEKDQALTMESSVGNN